MTLDDVETLLLLVRFRDEARMNRYGWKSAERADALREDIESLITDVMVANTMDKTRETPS